MTKRKRFATKERIDKKIKEGAGQGNGNSYKPWITIRDVPSKGLSTRWPGWTTGRLHHLLSQNELNYFFILDWSSKVSDIREQYPLSLEVTQDIAERLNIKHPTDPQTKELTVMTTDFLVDVNVDDQVKLIARTVKPEKDLNSKRVIEKLEIERTYWKEQGIDWGIVTEKEIPKNIANNIKRVHSALYMENAPVGVTQKKILQIEHALLEYIDSYREKPIADIALEVDDRLGLNPGDSLWVVKHLIAQKKWIVDMKKKIDTKKPLVISRAENIEKVGV